jgi:microcin C transport system permease protein
MSAYIFRRLLLMIPTLFGILLISFIIVQFAPGGPVEQIISDLSRGQTSNDRLGGTSSDFGAGDTTQTQVSDTYRGAQGLDPDLIEKLNKQFGYDQPASTRFFKMVWNYLLFDFGNSFFRNGSVIDLIKQKMPVSITLGLWITLISYFISIPLGISKALRDGSRYDVWTSSIIVIGYAIPGFLFGILLVVLFAGGSFWNWFPLRGLWSDNWETLSSWGKVKDYVWHITLPLTAMVLSAFATTTLLTKNSFLDEIKKQYVVTARAKGLSERSILYGHVFRNAMLILIAGFPGAFISAFFTGSILIENIFSLDGLGLLGFESVLRHDYPVVFGTLYIFSIMGLLVSLLSDLIYTWIDPRIDFERRDV